MKKLDEWRETRKKMLREKEENRAGNDQLFEKENLRVPKWKRGR